MKAILTDNRRPEATQHECEVLRVYPVLWDILASGWKQNPAERPPIDALVDQLEHLQAQGSPELL